ncbi:MAG: family 16 glycosylhydrolase, partial [Acidimicrobiia bacterium]
VFATGSPIIEQKPGVPSTNSYSVLPILSQLGVVDREKRLVLPKRALAEPVVAIGEPDSGLTSLATALAILGYRCCSDIDELPATEMRTLHDKRSSGVFNAYVNVGSIGWPQLVELARLCRGARFIVTTSADGNQNNCGSRAQRFSPVASLRGTGGSSTRFADLVEVARRRTLILPKDARDKWESLVSFLGCEYPAVPYPDRAEIGRRRVLRPSTAGTSDVRPEKRLKFDESPWIVPFAWPGIAVADSSAESKINAPSFRQRVHPLDDGAWRLRDDTFPGNLALFVSSNCRRQAGGLTTLTLRQERTAVRAFTSAAIASKRAFLYGHFAAEVRPPRSPGVVTGIFLYRSNPRQEIDLEILGRDTTRLLINVYYNPGDDGTKLEYGYRGTPILIDLGFDAACDFHFYEIEWSPGLIRWKVDKRVVHERVLWNPTPIPDLPMEFN